MNKDEAIEIVLRALENLNSELDPPIEVSPQTPLFGSEAVVDSLSLVSIIVDVESEASDAAGKPISLTDDRALNQSVSPFTNPDILSDYIVLLANERG